jgi:hypothetical protein
VLDTTLMMLRSVAIFTSNESLKPSKPISTDMNLSNSETHATKALKGSEKTPNAELHSSLDIDALRLPQGPATTVGSST